MSAVLKKSLELPEGWEILPVGSLGKAITGNTPPTKDPANYGGDIPFIKPTELVDRPVAFGRETISEKGAEKARILPKGGVLVSCIGNLGKTAIAKRDVAFNQQINAMVFNESVIPEYGFYYFQTAKFRKDLESLASATTISIVNKSKFESINVPVAPPEQQKRIVAKIEELFSHIDAGIEALKKAKQLLKQYRQSVLKAAVTGELTKEWREAKNLPAPKPGSFFIYVIKCDDDSNYIGHTQDLRKRWEQHCAGTGSEWTSKHKPKYVMHWEEFSSREEAAEKEKWLKTGYGRKWIKREEKAGRLRQAGLEPASQLLERILKERRLKWEEQQLEQFKAKGKMPKDDKWKEKYKEPVATRNWAFLSELPDSWTWASVDQIGDSQDQPVLTGPFGSNLGKGDFIQEGVPVLTIGCLQEEGIDLSRAMCVSKKKSEELERYQLKEGDMLFSRMAAVGRAGFVRPELAGALFNYHIMRLRLHPHAMLQEYFVHYVRGSSQVYDYVKEVNHGATRDGINTQQLLEMPVALSPLQEQMEICKVVGEKLGAIRRIESDINIQLMKAERNKQSVLASAFSGQI